MTRHRTLSTNSVGRHRRIVAVVLSGVLGAAALAACGSDSEPETGAQGRTKVVLGPARLESITNAATVVGAADKVFESCNLDVSLKASGGGGNQIQALQSGAIDVIYPSFSAVVPAFLKNADIVVIGGDSQGTNGMAWLTLPDSTMSSITDLKGKKVSISATGSNTQTVLKKVLTDQGISPDDVKQVVIAEVGAGLAALASKSADAVWATEPSVTTFETSGKAKVLFRADDYLEDNQLTVTAVRKDWAEKNPEVVKHVLACMQKTRDVAAAETARVAKDFAASAKLDPAIAETVLKKSIANNEPTLDLSIPGLQAVLDSLKDSGSIPADTTLDKLKGLFAVPDGAGVEVTGGTLP